MQKTDIFEQLNRLLLSQQLSRWMFILLLIVGAWVAGRSFNLLLQQEPSRGVTHSYLNLSKQSSSSSQSMDSVIALRLFGEEKAQVAATVVPKEAPNTKLSLRLSGLVYSTDPKRASALIESRGKELSYRSGETITGTKAKLKQVLLDRVIISHKGADESLLLDPPKSSKSSAGVSAARTNKTVAPDTKNTTIIQDSGRLSDYIRISPVQQDGAVRGYRINPGKQRQFFEDSGLMANDLAVAINGYDLSDKAQAMQIMQELPLLDDATVTVEREGQLEDVYVQLPQQ